MSGGGETARGRVWEAGRPGLPSQLLWQGEGQVTLWPVCYARPPIPAPGRTPIAFPGAERWFQSRGT